MPKLVTVVLVTALLAAGHTAAATAEDQVTKTKNVPPSAVLAAAPELSWQGMSFTIQPPKDFELSVQPGPGGGENFFWLGKQRADGTRATMTVLPVVRAAEHPNLTADSFIEAWFASGSKKADAMDNTAIEEPRVDGRVFRYATYRRVTDGVQFNGFIAATSAKSGIFAVTAQDIAGQNGTRDTCLSSLKSFSSTD